MATLDDFANSVKGKIDAVDLRLPQTLTSVQQSQVRENIGLGPDDDHTVPGPQGPEGPEGPPGTTTWAGITDKPTEFPPTDHDHDDRYYTEAEADTLLAGKSDTGHTHGQYVENTDARLSDARTPLAHDHDDQYVQTTDPRLTDARTPTAHSHDDRYYTEAEVDQLLAGVSGGGGGVTDHGALTGLTDDDHAHYALADGTRGDFAPTSHGHVLADISDYTAPDLSGLVQDTDPRLSDARTPTAHDHDDRYYTEAEVDTLLVGKSDTEHTHSEYVETTDARLSDARTPLAHGHEIEDVVGLVSELDERPKLDANGRLDAPVPPELLVGSTALGRSLLSVEAPSLTYNRSGETPAEAQIRTALTALGLINDETVETPPTLVEVLEALEPLYLLTLDESTGDFMDATGGGHDGTPMGSMTRSQPSLVPSDSEGKSVLLDGASGYILMPSGAGVVPAVNPAQGAFSLAFTMQASPTTGDRVYYEGNTANSGASFNFLPSNTTNLQVQFRDDSGTFILNGTPTTTADVLDGDPHLVVFTYDHGVATWWVDGLEAGGATVTPPSGNVLLDDDLTAAPLGSNPTSYLQSAWDATVSSVTMSRASVVQDGENRFIRVQYPQGITGATNSGASWRAHFADSMEATCRYRVRFDSGFDWTEGGKLPGLAGGSSPSGGNPATDGFSARYMWKPNGGLIVYLYHSEQPGDYGQAFNLNQSLARNVWHTIEQRIVMNTPGQANGSIEVWVNGEKKLNKTDMKWRLSGDSWMIDSFYFSTFHGGTGAAYQPNRNNHADFDDVLITAGEGAGTFTAPRVTWGAFGRTNVTDFLDGGLDTLAGFPRALTGPEVTSVYEAWTA